jgi:hypothetical protein
MTMLEAAKALNDAGNALARAAGSFIALDRRAEQADAMAAAKTAFDAALACEQEGNDEDE